MELSRRALPFRRWLSSPSWDEYMGAGGSRRDRRRRKIARVGDHRSHEERCRRRGETRDRHWLRSKAREWRVDPDRPLGNEPAPRSGEKMRPMTGLRVLSIALVAVGCSSGMRNAASSPVMPAADAAAIRAVFDTTAFGWNHGDLSAYLYAYAPSATAMGRTGLVHGPSGIEEQMRAGFWKTGRPI